MEQKKTDIGSRQVFWKESLRIQHLSKQKKISPWAPWAGNRPPTGLFGLARRLGEAWKREDCWEMSEERVEVSENNPLFHHVTQSSIE